MGENHSHGPLPTILSLLFGTFAMITMKDAQVWVSISAGVIGFVSGCFAIRYYYLAIKEKKENLNKK